ncbi:MAG TPA: lactate permease LctP family transporter [Bryobacteraceae bacterium]|nr:lactate permease LctP family transporter [Bryobacteraceae bacterium]
MWQHNYTPLDGNLFGSAAIASLPIVTLLLLLGVLRKPAWISALSGLATTILVALFLYGMPVAHVFSATLFGAAFGLFPIGWIVIGAVFLYRITVETKNFEVIKYSLGNLTQDRRLQALLIAFAFGAFLEGAAGFGTPVAVAAAMLAGLGFSPFFAAALCLLANTAPVAFGSIGIPAITLAGITGLPLDRLSAAIGRICAPVSLFVPGYIVVVMGGWTALARVFPAALVCGGVFAGLQFLISNYVGPQLTDLIASLGSIVALVLLFMVWKPKDTDRSAAPTQAGGPRHAAGSSGTGAATATAPLAAPVHYTPRQVLLAWSPYLLLVAVVLLWGWKPMQAPLNSVSKAIAWPGLHNQIARVPPVTSKVTPYAAVFNFNWLSAAGTSCLIACILSAFVLRVSPLRFLKIFGDTLRQLAFAMVTLAAVLGLAYLMNYCGATGTLGLAFAATGASFPFFGAILGWLGVFLTGSDTSANALFGNLQVITATRLNLNPVLMAAANSAGGVMGKMISLSSIAVAAAATGMAPEEEAKLFRFTLKHSIFLASLIGLVVLFYAYVAPGLQP